MLLAGRVVRVVLVLMVLAPPAFAAPATRTYVSGKFALYLNGNFAGFVNKVSGGFAEGTVVEELPPTDYFVQKHLDWPPSFEDITIVAGPGMDMSFYQWVRNTMEGNFSRTTDGSIVAYDSTNKAIRTLEFYDAQITQVTLPKLDASSKDAATMTVKITPSSTWSSAGGVAFPGGSTKQTKKWLSSSYRFLLDGLDTSRVSKVEELVVNIPLGYPPNTFCIICPPPLAISFPNLEVRVSSSFAQSLVQWYENSVYNGSAQEKNGSIEYLSPDFKTVLFKLTLHNVGPISTENLDSDGVAVTVVRMYSEIIKLELPSSGVN